MTKPPHHRSPPASRRRRRTLGGTSCRPGMGRVTSGRAACQPAPGGRRSQESRAPKGADMDFSAQLDTLRKRVDDTVATVKAAATENREQLKVRIDKAQVDANLALKDVEQKAGQAGDKAQSKWAPAKADAAAK